MLDSLTGRERRVLQLRFGLEDGRARTLEEVGKEFNVTRERIRQIEAKALRKLRHPSPQPQAQGLPGVAGVRPAAGYHRQSTARAGRRRTDRPHGRFTMKFIVGLLSGLVLGAVGAVAYSVSTGRDLREEYAQLRGDIDNRDFDALGNRLEQRFNELQGMLQERANQIQGAASSNGDAGAAIDDAKAAASDAVDAASDAVKDAGDAVADAASELPKG